MNNKSSFFRYLVLIISILILGLSFVIGREDFFLDLNTDLGNTFNNIFAFFTFIGDAVVWIPFLIYIALKKRKYLYFSLAVVVVSTIIIQGLKRNSYTDSLRPFYSIQEPQKSQIHYVEFYEPAFILKSNFLKEQVWNKFIVEEIYPQAKHSFPSGHTGTAFCILLIVVMFAKSWLTCWGMFLYAMLVGYSRVYLAQHFPLDVGASMLIALISVLIVDKIFKLKPKEFKYY